MSEALVLIAVIASVFIGGTVVAWLWAIPLPTALPTCSLPLSPGMIGRVITVGAGPHRQHFRVIAVRGTTTLIIQPERPWLRAIREQVRRLVG